MVLDAPWVPRIKPNNSYIHNMLLTVLRADIQSKKRNYLQPIHEGVVGGEGRAGAGPVVVFLPHDLVAYSETERILQERLPI